MVSYQLDTHGLRVVLRNAFFFFCCVKIYGLSEHLTIQALFLQYLCTKGQYPTNDSLFIYRGYAASASFHLPQHMHTIVVLTTVFTMFVP